WHALFSVFNKGTRILDNWSYDVELVNSDNGDRIPIKTQVPGDPIPVFSSQYINSPSSFVFDESHKGGNWRLEVTVQVKDPEHPEPPERQTNNFASWPFVVQNPVPDIGVFSKCVTDSSKNNCIYSMLPGQPWDVVFYAYNKGDLPLDDWSYDINLIDSSGTRIPIKVQAPGPPIAVGYNQHVTWTSRHVLPEEQAGTWHVDVRPQVKNPDRLDPPERQGN